ncbi:hypothetical protein PHISCL_03121 [Aspergillus sclerotialis]|uniref:Uncharacterized protein n=1 Tax=Aspergillus sclerotialis TaxID=2070753 RepID=A0A3A2ZYT7_9EURO|nr:hypothetical protein PHISCL_03121 [Aspergillus sclerotialis]
MDKGNQLTSQALVQYWFIDNCPHAGSSRLAQGSALRALTRENGDEANVARAAEHERRRATHNAEAAGSNTEIETRIQFNYWFSSARTKALDNIRGWKSRTIAEMLEDIDNEKRSSQRENPTLNLIMVQEHQRLVRYFLDKFTADKFFEVFYWVKPHREIYKAQYDAAVMTRKSQLRIRQPVKQEEETPTNIRRLSDPNLFAYPISSHHQPHGH